MTLIDIYWDHTIGKNVATLHFLSCDHKEQFVDADPRRALDLAVDMRDAHDSTMKDLQISSAKAVQMMQDIGILSPKVVTA